MNSLEIFVEFFGNLCEAKFDKDASLKNLKTQITKLQFRSNYLETAIFPLYLDFFGNFFRIFKTSNTKD